MNLATFAILTFAGAALFLGVFFRAWMERSARDSDRNILRVYGLAGAAGVVLLGGILLGWLSFLRPRFLEQVPVYLLIVWSLIFYDTTRRFFRLEPMGALGWVGGLLVTTILLAADALYEDVAFLSSIPQLPMITLVAGGVAWVVLSAMSVQLVLLNYRTNRQPLYRNRISYWILTLVLTILGSIGILAENPGIGSVLLGLGALNGSYVMLTYRAADIRLGALRFLSFLLTTLLVIVIYTAVYVVNQFIFQQRLGQSPIVAGVIMSVVLAFIFRPLLGVIERSLDQRLGRGFRDNSQMLREYSLTISNIIDIDQLATVALGLISESMEIRRGMLFLVDQAESDGGGVVFELQSVHSGMGMTQPPPGRLNIDSPIAIYLSKERRPLIQYDIDFLDLFHGATSEEKSWFARLGMDVFVPIYGHGLWIGLLGIGSKASGVPFTADDLTLLSTLADQTSVALENSRLVEGLVEINKRVETAYSNLAKTKQELERLDRAKSDFISIASHELRTPLTVIHGYSQMLADAPDIKTNEYFNSLVQGINNGTIRLGEIVESMLDVAKIDNRELDLAPMPLPISSILESVTRQFDKETKERNLSLSINRLQGLPPIEVDREAVQKVFYHLIINAIKYTPDGGTIEIYGQVVTPGQSGYDRDAIQVTVSDTGIGIAPEHQKLIFRKFYQTGEISLHSTGKTKFKGAGPGLGLAIAQGVVEAHGGRIWAESPGYDENSTPGSKFHVILPLKQELVKEGDEQEAAVSEPQAAG